MSAVVAYEDLYGQGGEKFVRMFQYRVNEVADEWRIEQAKNALQEAAARLIPGIEDLAFRTLLAVREKIALSSDLIGTLRSLYLEINTTLENPAMEILDADIREALINSSRELASNICIADMANSQKIREIVAQVKAHG